MKFKRKGKEEGEVWFMWKFKWGRKRRELKGIVFNWRKEFNKMKNLGKWKERMKERMKERI